MNLIDGVILVEILRNPNILCIIVSFVLIIVGLIIIKLADFIMFDGFDFFKLILGCFFVVFGLFFSSFCYIFDKSNIFLKPNGQYKVVITSEVNAEEFQSTYEIVDFKDSYFIIKENKKDEY